MSTQVKISTIQFSEIERQRKTMDEAKILELVESFRTVGQIQAIVIDHTSTLRAGRRRLEAAKRLGWEEIRAEIFETLSPLKQAIVEFDENTKRQDLSWQDEVTALANIHRLLAESKGKTEVDKIEVARTLGISEGKVYEDLQLAEHLDNKRVTARPTRRGALKTMQREKTLEITRELARRRVLKMAGGEAIENAKNFGSGIIHWADCRVVLKAMSENSVDLVVMDPPWGINIHDASQTSQDWVPSYTDAPEEVQIIIREVIIQLYRVLKPGAHIYSFFPIQELDWWIRCFGRAGLWTRRRPLVWFKAGQPAITDHYMAFMPVYETILWGYKPGENNTRKYFSVPIPEAWSYPRQPQLWHEHEKPVDMLKNMVEASSVAGETVLDPFCGGGSSLAAAFEAGRFFIGIEQDEISFNKACKRLAKLEEGEEEDGDGTS